MDVVRQGIYAGSGKWLEELVCGFSQGVNPAKARRVNFIRLSALDPVSYTHLRAHETCSNGGWRGGG